MQIYSQRLFTQFIGISCKKYARKVLLNVKDVDGVLKSMHLPTWPENLSIESSFPNC